MYLIRQKQPANASLRRVVSSNGEFVSDLRQVGGFLRVLRFPPPIKLTNITEILLKVALNTINQTKPATEKLRDINILLSDAVCTEVRTQNDTRGYHGNHYMTDAVIMLNIT
jgi:hypothetical protein